MIAAARSDEEKRIFLEYLRERRLKRTRQKELILEVFLRTEGHSSVEDIYRLVKGRDKSIGYVTVYRTLKLLAQCGLAREINLGDGITRYEHFYGHPHHDHIVCVSCHKTIEFLSPAIEQLQDKIVSRYNFKPLHHSLRIYGTCSSCQSQKGRKAKDESTCDKVFLRDALKLVIDVSARCLNFYLSAAERTENSKGKEIFYAIADSERKRLEDLLSQYGRLLRKERGLDKEPVFLHLDALDLEEILPADMLLSIPVDTDDVKALTILEEIAGNCYRFFLKFAEKLQESRGRKILLDFAEAQRKHLAEVAGDKSSRARAQLRSSS